MVVLRASGPCCQSCSKSTGRPGENDVRWFYMNRDIRRRSALTSIQQTLHTMSDPFNYLFAGLSASLLQILFEQTISTGIIKFAWWSSARSIGVQSPDRFAESNLLDRKSTASRPVTVFSVLLTLTRLYLGGFQPTGFVPHTMQFPSVSTVMVLTGAPALVMEGTEHRHPITFCYHGRVFNLISSIMNV